MIEYQGDDLELKDARVGGGEHCFRRLIDIGKECVSHRAKDRPEMVAVLVLLEGVKC